MRLMALQQVMLQTYHYYHCACKESLLPAGSELVFLAQTGGGTDFARPAPDIGSILPHWLR